MSRREVTTTALGLLATIAFLIALSGLADELIRGIKEGNSGAFFLLITDGLGILCGLVLAAQLSFRLWEQRMGSVDHKHGGRRAKR